MSLILRSKVISIRAAPEAVSALLARRICISSARVFHSNLSHCYEKPKSLWRQGHVMDFRTNNRSLSTLPSHSALSMPALSPTMTQGNIAKWMIKVGQKISPGDHLCDLETDKATIAWEAQDEGYVGAILMPEGSSDVPVGQVVLVICDNEADIPAFASYKATAAAAPSPAAASAPPAAAAAPSPPRPPAAAPPKPTPAAVAAAAKPAPQAPAGSGGGLLNQMRQRQWAFSKQYGLPTPQNQYA